MAGITRKKILRLAALGIGAAAGGRFLAACNALLTPPAPAQALLKLPTSSSAPTEVPATVPTSSPEPSITTLPTAIRRSDVIKFFPTVPSRVVHTHHQGVWEGDTLQVGALRLMLDACITRLTGLADATSAWQALFAPTSGSRSRSTPGSMADSGHMFPWSWPWRNACRRPGYLPSRSSFTTVPPMTWQEAAFPSTGMVPECAVTAQTFYMKLDGRSWIPA